jgi:hypothetical protein
MAAGCWSQRAGDHWNSCGIFVVFKGALRVVSCGNNAMIFDMVGGRWRRMTDVDDRV